MIEAATSSRATCKGCKKKIAKGELRFGDEVPGNFDGMMTFWYHLPCAVTFKPEKLRAALAKYHKLKIPDRAELEAALGDATIAARVARMKQVEKAKTGRSVCQHCKLKIEKDTLRVEAWLTDDRFMGTGFVHLGCIGGWTGSTIDAALIKKAGKADKAGVTAILAAQQLMDTDPRGKELEVGVRVAKKPAAEISVLADWLEGHGAVLPGAELAQLLAARKKLAAKKPKKK